MQDSEGAKQRLMLNDEQSSSAVRHVPHGRRLLLLGSFGVLFTRYCIATFLSSFFPQYAQREGISDTFNGTIFAAYPFGMAITSVVAAQVIRKLGTRSATILGLCATTMFTVAFGLAPDVCTGFTAGGSAEASSELKAVFLISYFLNGLFGALAETACIIMVSARFKENAAAVMAAVNTVCTLGCMVGPVIGGVLYDVGGSTGGEAWAFRLPFLVCAAAPILLLPLVPFFMPQLYIGSDEDTAVSTTLTSNDTVAAAGSSTGMLNACTSTTDATASRHNEHAPVIVDAAPTTTESVEVQWSMPADDSQSSVRIIDDSPASRLVLLSPSIGLGLASIALSGTVVGTLDPTLSIRLAAPPFYLSPTCISFFFLYSSVVYVCISTPTGWLIDRAPTSSRLYKLITLAGFLVLALTFLLLAPFGFSAWSAAGPADAMQGALNTLPSAVVALGLKGIGSALSNVAIYPDLVIEVPDDAMLQASISGLWNAAYAVGWALGPILGDVLMEGMRANRLCISSSDRQQTPLQCFEQVLPSCSPNSSSCSCEWRPDNGFDGFASTIAVACAAYATVLAVAAMLNVRGPNLRQARHARRALNTTVEPLHPAPQSA